MTNQRINRRLAAIMAVDIVGFSARMGDDEDWMVAALRILWSDVLQPEVGASNGRIVKMMGDGALVEFGSAVDSVECAIAIQNAMEWWNATYSERKAILLRIGVNLGEIIIEQDDILGDGVNIAARLESLAPPGGVLISDSVHMQVVGKLSVVFTDMGEIALKNIAKPVRSWRWGGDSNYTLPTVIRSADKPSIAILPFANIGNEIENAYFADGLVEDITNTLSRLSGLSVVARNASLSYRDGNADVREVARNLGARYILEGSVRQGAFLVRVNVQLIDTDSGVHMWSERYDRKITDVFAVQDEITLRVATEMQVKLIEGEQARLRYTTTTNVEAWNNYIQGLAHFRTSVNKDSITRTRGCLDRALALDPNSAALNASLAFVHCTDARFSKPEKRSAILAIGKKFIDRALALDPDNADALTAYSMHQLIEGNFEKAAQLAQAALELAPDSADVVAFSSYIYACTGRGQDALAQIQKAMTLSPYCPPNYFAYHGNALRWLGRYDEAIAAFRLYETRIPGSGIVDLVISFQQANRIEEAEQEAQRLLKLNPQFSIANWCNTQFYSDPTKAESDQMALWHAGLPE
jgi:adenylate cyclase